MTYILVSYLSIFPVPVANSKFHRFSKIQWIVNGIFKQLKRLFTSSSGTFPDSFWSLFYRSFQKKHLLKIFTSATLISFHSNTYFSLFFWWSESSWYSQYSWLMISFASWVTAFPLICSSLTSRTHLRLWCSVSLVFLFSLTIYPIYLVPLLSFNTFDLCRTFLACCCFYPFHFPTLYTIYLCSLRKGWFVIHLVQVLESRITWRKYVDLITAKFERVLVYCLDYLTTELFPSVLCFKKELSRVDEGFY